MSSGLFARQPLFLRKTAAVLVIAVVFMWLDSKNPAWFANIRSASHAAMQPIYQFSLIPNFATNWSVDSLKTKEALRRENVKLQTQLIHANAQLQQQDYILAENGRLRGLVATSQAQNYDLQLAKVIGTDSNFTKQIVVLNKGKQDGVSIGQTVIDENGILGQVLNVYQNTSRLLLITDKEQSLSVILKSTGQRAIVSGKGDPNTLSLDFIFKTSDVSIGDELISSGLGSRFPAGYKVGTVKAINPEQSGSFISIDVTPAADFKNNAFVLILQPKNKTMSGQVQAAS